MNEDRLRKSSQEQAVAAWVYYLNQIRIKELALALQSQHGNFVDAMGSIEDAWEKIQDLITSNRGGDKGLHGFIAEIAQVGLGNAKELLHGRDGIYEWVNDNGPSDLIKDGIPVQMKFVQQGGKFSLNAIEHHLSNYPDFITKKGGKYQIPKDFYEDIKTIWETPEAVANKWSRNDGKFTLKNWKYVHELLSSNELSFEDIEPSDLTYDSVQKNTIEETISTISDRLSDENKVLEEELVKEHQPTLLEGIATAGMAAAAEASTTAFIAIKKKRRAGKKLKEFTPDDWKEIAGESAIGAGKGGIRGISIYVLSNYTLTAPAVANTLVTASFGIAEQAHKLRTGEISEKEFIDNSEMLSLETACSALFSCIGGTLIPIPILGALIGNAVGSMLFSTGKDVLSAREQELIAQYQADQMMLDEELQQQYESCLKQLKESFDRFLSIMTQAFSPDIEQAFVGSIELAKDFGVPDDEILDTKEKVSAYFLD